MFVFALFLRDLFFSRGVLELLGSWTAFFCKSIDFKAFLRCSYVHLFLFLLLFFEFCKEIISFPKKEGMLFRVEGNEEGIHLYRYVLNLTMQNHFDGLVTSYTCPLKMWEEKTQWTEPLLKRGGE